MVEQRDQELLDKKQMILLQGHQEYGLMVIHQQRLPYHQNLIIFSPVHQNLLRPDINNSLIEKAWEIDA